MNRADLASALHGMRTKKQLSQAALGRMIGKPASTISRIESGELEAPIDLVNAWAVACGKEAHLSFGSGEWPTLPDPGPASPKAWMSIRRLAVEVLEVVKAAPESMESTIATTIDQERGALVRHLQLSIASQSVEYFARCALEAAGAFSTVTSTTFFDNALTGEELSKLRSNILNRMDALLSSRPSGVHPAWTRDVLLNTLSKAPFITIERAVEIVRGPPG